MTNKNDVEIERLRTQAVAARVPRARWLNWRGVSRALKTWKLWFAVSCALLVAVIALSVALARSGAPEGSEYAYTQMRYNSGTAVPVRIHVPTGRTEVLSVRGGWVIVSWGYSR